MKKALEGCRSMPPQIPYSIGSGALYLINLLKIIIDDP